MELAIRRVLLRLATDMTSLRGAGVSANARSNGPVAPNSFVGLIRLSAA